MLDIFADEWKHPPRSAAPLFTLDLSALDRTEAARRVAHCRSLGGESLFLVASDAPPCDGVLEEVLECAEKRHMTAVIHEDIVFSSLGLTDHVIAASNPMLSAHTLRVDDGTEPLHPGEEIIACEETDGAKHRLILCEDCDFDIDLMLPEAAEVLISAVYEPFLERYASARSVISGVFTDRLCEFSHRSLPWSYEMLDSYVANGGNVAQLTALVLGRHGRGSESARLAHLTAAETFESVFVSKVREFFEAHSVMLIGVLPDSLLSSCADGLSLHAVPREHSDDLNHIACRGDISRLCGGHGAVYFLNGLSPCDIYSEVARATSAGACMYILPTELSAPSYIDEVGASAGEIRSFFERIRRLSYIGANGRRNSGTALLCDDCVISDGSADKLRAKFAQFTFLPRSLLCKRAKMSDNVVLIGSNSFNAVLADKRIRLTPSDVLILGRFTANGGRLLRDGGFSDFVSKQNGAICGDRELLSFDSQWCGMRRLYVCNPSGDVKKFTVGDTHGTAACLADQFSGKILKHGTGEITIRLAPGEYAYVIFSDLPCDGCDREEKTQYLSEVISVHPGENIVTCATDESVRCALELYGARGAVRIKIGNRHATTLLSPPYILDLTDMLDAGDNIVSVECDGDFTGVVRKLKCVDDWRVI